MIPTFPEFKKLELSDQKEIERFTKRFPPYSDFNFVSLWSWNIKDEIIVSKLNDNLIVRFSDYVTGEPFYSFIGNTEVNDTIEALLELSAKEGLPPVLKLVPEISTRLINPKKFSVNESRDHFDYVYLPDELRSYAGSKFVKKRNHVNNFIKTYPSVYYQVISLKESHVQKKIFKLFEKWENIKYPNVEEKGLHDFAAMKKLLEAADNFDLIGIGVFIEDELVGFFVNEIVDNDNVMAHMMKADVSVSAGIYAFLMQKNAEILFNLNAQFFNFQQDLGLESLRVSKTRFRPHKFLKKFEISYTQPS